jgi:hypothetical protein
MVINYGVKTDSVSQFQVNPAVKLAEVDFSPHLVQADGEMLICHLSGHKLGEGGVGFALTIKTEMVALDKGRRKEGKTLDVVPVGVGDKNIAAKLFTVFDQLAPQTVYSAAGIKNKQAFPDLHLHTGGVASVFQGIRARYGNRPSYPPEYNLEISFCH